MDRLVSKVIKTNHLSCDVLVAGGGIAGVCCAIAAARAGSEVVLCQDRSVLGGNASSEIRMHICGADMSGLRGEKLSVEAREGGIVEEIRLENAVRNPQMSWSMLDLILYEKCVCQENLTLLLDTPVIAVCRKDRKIEPALASCQSTENEYIIIAKIYVDCTGDGRLAAEAGCQFRVGREAKDEFNEPHGLEKADTKTMGSSLLFEGFDYGRTCEFIPPKFARNFTEKQLSLRPHESFSYGYWWLEWGGNLDTIKDNAKIREELLSIATGVWNHIKNEENHNAETWALSWLGFVPGKRESRRFKGLYTFTENDVMNHSDFDDTIAYGGWSVDTHPIEGIDAVDTEPCNQPKPPYLYPVPLRVCISSDVDNLMFAGRNISATHLGFSSLRVMATCGVIGQAVGTAAAICTCKGVLPVDIVRDNVSLEQLQSKLIDDDCFLPGVNIESNHITSTAKITSSSFVKGGEPANVRRSDNRANSGLGGISPRYLSNNKSFNRWISKGHLPAWIDFLWDKPIIISGVNIVFDTGLHRPLTLIRCDSPEARVVKDKMIYAPQPETVRDYKVQVCDEKGWKDVVLVRDNYQRLNVHKFEPILTSRCRLLVEKTNGSDSAIICNLKYF